MIPVLFDSNNIAFNRLGKGKLSDTISCVISETLNGEYSLELKYPVSGPLFAELCEGGTIGAYGPQYGYDSAGMEYFDIYKRDVPIDGVVTFYAQHISRRLSGNVFYGNTGKVNFAYLFSNSKPRDIGIDALGVTGEGDETITFPVSAPKSTLATLIGSEESVVSCGWDTAFVCSNRIGSGWNPDLDVHIIQERGEDNGIQIRHGYNLLDLNYTQDSGATYNALVPYWTDGNGTNRFVTNYVVQPTTPITPIIAAPYDCTSDFSSRPTEAQMITLAQSILDSSQPWNPETTIEVDYYNSDITNPHGARLALGDYVSVYWGEALLAEKLRVVSTEYDVLSEGYAKLHLGTKQSEFVAITGDTSADGSKYAIEHGTSNGWEYWRYPDGHIEATRQISQTLSDYNTVNGFYGYYIPNIATPFTMANTSYYVGCAWSVGTGFGIPAGLLSVTTSKFNAYAISTANGSVRVTLKLHLIGVPA